MVVYGNDSSGSPHDLTIVIDLVEEGSNFFHLSSQDHAVPSNLLDW